jgi:hypothetical protein
MTIHDVPTHLNPNPEREPTPQVTIEDEAGFRRATLHKGAIYNLKLETMLPLEHRDVVREEIGINADLLAEISLGSEHTMFILDRGDNSQGVEEPIIPGSDSIVSDRFLIADLDFLMRANLRHGMGKQLENMQGLTQLCAGSSIDLGREYDPEEQFDVNAMPASVSRKHASVIVGVLTLSSAIVEPIIALSIAAMAISTVYFRNNKYLQNVKYKLGIIFIFGLFHGLGFAGLLQEIQVPEDKFVASLLAFNIGIEAGQLMIIGLALPVIYLLRDKPWYDRSIKVIAVAISAVAIFWMLQRILI